LLGSPESTSSGERANVRYFATVLLNGLRDYGTGQWEGGNADCDHIKPITNYNKGFNERYGNGDGTAAQNALAPSSPVAEWHAHLDLPKREF